MSLQYGVPLEVYVRKFSHTRFEPWGYTKNPDIPVAKSLVDYLFRWLGNEFIPGYREANRPGIHTPGAGHGSGGGESSGSAEDAEAERTPAATMARGLVGGQGTSRSAVKVETGKGDGRDAAKPRGADAVKAASPNGTAAVHVSARTAANGAAQAAVLERAGAALRIDPNASPADRQSQFATFQIDAPVCDGCGAITVRNGNCYLCHNCGNSMGCS